MAETVKIWKIFRGFEDLLATARLEGGLIKIQAYKDDKLIVYMNGNRYFAEGTLEGAIAILSITNDPMELDPISFEPGFMDENGMPDEIVWIYLDDDGKPKSFAHKKVYINQKPFVNTLWLDTSLREQAE